MTSILETVENFYADVVRRIKPWTPPPVKVRDDEPHPADMQGASEQKIAADAPTGNITDLVQASTSG